MNGEYHIRKAYESILDADFEKAIAHFKEAVECEPHNAAYHYKLSMTYARSAKLRLALEHAERACELDEAEQEYRYHYQQLRAKQLVQQSEQCLALDRADKVDACLLLKQAIQLDPLLMEAYVLLASTYLELGEIQSAESILYKAMNISPDYEATKKLLEEIKKHKKNRRDRR